MKLNFLSRQEARELFSTPDEYALNLPVSNLQKISPDNPTLDGYQEIFLDSFRDPSEISIRNLKDHSRTLGRLDFEVNIVMTAGSHALDIAQTRRNCILVPRGFMSRRIFVHEVYHTLSRAYPILTQELSKVWGFKKVMPQVITHPNYLLNPDAVINDYVIKVFHKKAGEELSVVPFMVSGLGTMLKLYNEDKYLNHYETNYSSLISDTSYIAHPEEICAEYFALSAIGVSIFGNYQTHSPQLKFFTLTLLKLLQELELWHPKKVA